jgi:hypothetical protein
MTEEKILETRVVEEQRTQKASVYSKLGAAVLCIAIASAGYGIHAVQVSSGHISKNSMLRVSGYAAQKGYIADIWKQFPEKDKLGLIKQELDSMPFEQSWSLVKPTIDRKANHEWDPRKKERKFVYETLKQYLKGD